LQGRLEDAVICESIPVQQLIRTTPFDTCRPIGSEVHG